MQRLTKAIYFLVNLIVALFLSNALLRDIFPIRPHIFTGERYFIVLLSTFVLLLLLDMAVIAGFPLKKKTGAKDWPYLKWAVAIMNLVVFGAMIPFWIKVAQGGAPSRCGEFLLWAAGFCVSLGLLDVIVLVRFYFRNKKLGVGTMPLIMKIPLILIHPFFIILFFCWFGCNLTSGVSGAIWIYIAPFMILPIANMVIVCRFPRKRQFTQ